MAQYGSIWTIEQLKRERIFRGSPFTFTFTFTFSMLVVVVVVQFVIIDSVCFVSRCLT